jgi:hypothetical protein
MLPSSTGNSFSRIDIHILICGLSFFGRSITGRYPRIPGICCMISSKTLARILTVTMKMVHDLLNVLTTGAWPVIIDEFVAYGKEKAGGGDERMAED